MKKIFNIFSFVLRKIFVFTIKLYQYFISPLLPSSCRFYPTCSSYAIEAITAHGILRGCFLMLCRLLRCHPWAAGGYDPVPPPKSKIL